MGACWPGESPKGWSARGALFTVFVCAVVCGLIFPVGAQDLWHFHPRLEGRAYRDDRIAVIAPASWSIAIDHSSDGTDRGAILRKGKYILRLCTACQQTSGIVGGRFSEIAGLVQPWFRADPLANPSACGHPQTTPNSKQLERVDLWFRRDPGHAYDEDADDCRQPKTTATVWYGSYFAERCAGVPPGDDCGGFFLHFDWLTDPHAKALLPLPEMAIGVTYEETSLDLLPRQDDPELERVLAEASLIVRSVRYMKPAETAH